jgi:hypothetical protein
MYLDGHHRSKCADGHVFSIPNIAMKLSPRRIFGASENSEVEEGESVSETDSSA